MPAPLTYAAAPLITHEANAENSKTAGTVWEHMLEFPCGSILYEWVYVIMCGEDRKQSRAVARRIKKREPPKFPFDSSRCISNQNITIWESQ